jgi:hypothetical protein
VKTKGKHPQAAEPTMETLRELFNPHLKLPKARLTCFLMLVLAVFGQRTVSLVWLARHATTQPNPSLTIANSYSSKNHSFRHFHEHNSFIISGVLSWSANVVL